MMSKCGKKVAHEHIGKCVTDVLTTFEENKTKIVQLNCLLFLL